MVAGRFCIPIVILHASAIDIIWETGFVMAQLWPSFSPSLASFLQPLLSRAHLAWRFFISDQALSSRLARNFLSFFLTFRVFFLFCFVFLFFCFFYSWFKIVCPFLLYSKVTQLYISTFFFSSVFYHVLSQVLGYGCLCSTSEPHCPSILNIELASTNPKLPTNSSPLATTSLFSMSVSLFLFCR